MTKSFYYHQHGAGIPVFRGGVMQKGYGLGGLFKGLMRTVTPHLKRGLLKAGQHVLKNGIQVMEDVENGQNLRSSIKKRAAKGINDVFSSVLPNKKKRTSTSTVSRKQKSKSKGRLGVL